MSKVPPLPEAVRRLVFATAATAAFAEPIQLDAGEAGDDTKTTSWVQVAREGTFRGHARGEFTLDARCFAELIKNFRAHGWFHRGEDGYGDKDVIPFDWRHASEQPPANGGPAAMQVQAAIGWAQDLETRTGPDGRLQLWAKARLLSEAKTLVREGAIKSCSVAIWPNANDPVSNVPIGWYMSSIALTNDPFIQGMAQIQANRIMIDPYSPPKGPAEIAEKLRDIFGLPEMSGLGTVLSQIAALRSVATGAATAPLGVDVEELVCALRCLFNLPTLSTPAEVFAETDKLVGMIAKATSPAGGASPITTTADRTPAAPQKEEQNMDYEKAYKALLAHFAGHIGISGSASEDEVKNGFALTVERANGGKLLLDAMGTKSASDAVAKYKAIASHLGVPDKGIDLALENCRTMMERSAKMAKDMPDLAEHFAKSFQERIKGEDAAVKQDVDGAMLERGMRPDDEAMKPIRHAMLFMRTGGAFIRPETITAEKVLTAEGRAATAAFLADRAAAAEVFLKEYPPRGAGAFTPPTPSTHAALFEHFGATIQHGGAAPAGPVQFNRGPANSFGPQGGTPTPAGGTVVQTPAGQIDLARFAAMPGNNVVEKGRAYYLEAVNAAAKDEPLGRQMELCRPYWQAAEQAAAGLNFNLMANHG